MNPFICSSIFLCKYFQNNPKHRRYLPFMIFFTAVSAENYCWTVEGMSFSVNFVNYCNTVNHTCYSHVTLLKQHGGIYLKRIDFSWNLIHYICKTFILQYLRLWWWGPKRTDRHGYQRCGYCYCYSWQTEWSSDEQLHKFEEHNIFGK